MNTENVKKVDSLKPIVNFKGKVFIFSHTQSEMVQVFDGIKSEIKTLFHPIYRTIEKGRWKYASKKKSLQVHNNI